MNKLYTILTIFLFTLLLGIPSISVYGQTYTITRFDYNWCTSTYPTPYVTGSFSIIETSFANSGQDGFTKNQTAGTIIISLPAGFEFDIAPSPAATITQSGPGPAELTGISFVYNSVTQITVTLTSALVNDDLTSLNFNNFKFRAMSAGSSGDILRTGGNFQIDQSTTNPTNLESMGALTASAPFAYIGSAVTQPNTSTVNQYSINNEIIGIAITGNPTGSCNGVVTIFNLSTVGGNGTGSDLPTQNITNAKIYYTGNSSTFATTTFYGSSASPNGSFSITGSQNLLSGTNYFWVTYDVAGAANTSPGNNRLDAQLVSFVLNGITRTDMTTPTPVGFRPIIGATYYYSRATNNWNNNLNWSYTSGGPACMCQPNGTGVAVIDVGHTITANAIRTVDVIEIRNGATLTGGSPLTVNSVVTTAGTGRFTLGTVFTVLGNVILIGTGQSTVNGIIDINGDVNIGFGTRLSATQNNTAIYIGGNLTVNGTLEHIGANSDIFLDVGSSFIIDGTGTIPSGRTLYIQAGGRIILSTANLTITPPVVIQGAYIVENNGIITLIGSLDATSGSAKWLNAVGSQFNYNNIANMFFTAGILEANALGNTVNYSAAGAQNIKLPNNGGQYYNLTCSGSGIKTLPASVIVNGNVQISGTSQFDASIGNYNIDIAGNWGVTSTNINPFIEQLGAVNFNGTAAQTITTVLAAGETFNDLTINNSTALLSSATITLGNVINVNAALTLTRGYIVTTTPFILNMNAGSFTVGTSANSYVNGPMTKTGTTSFIFPVGYGNGTRWARIAIGAPTLSTTFRAQYFATIPPNWNIMAASPLPVLNNVSVKEYWQLDRTVGTGNATVTLYWEDAGWSEINDCSTTDLRVARNNGAAWQNNNNVVTTTGVCAGAGNAGTVSTSAVVTLFSPFTFGSLSGAVNPLPIELISFDAKCNNGKIDITWVTASETNNAYFTIERSSDAISFEDIRTVDGAENGNSNQPISYSYTDMAPLQGSSYYRLKQTDFDGNFEYFSMVSVSCENINLPELIVFPNPSDGHFTIDFGETDSQLIIMNSLGQVVVDQKTSSIITQMDLSNLSPGVYFLMVYHDGQNHGHAKIIIK